MVSHFAVGKFRVLEAAGYFSYPIPENHPERRFPPFHDFVYIESGGWSVSIAGENFEVIPGDVMVLPAWVPSGSESFCEPGTCTYFLHIKPVVGDTIGGAPPTNDGILRLPISTVIHCQSKSIIRDLFNEIVVHDASDYLGRDEMISSMVQTLMSLLHDCEQNVEKKHTMLNSCFDIMRNSPNMFFKEEEMAEHLFVSAKTLRKLFLSQFNKSFYQYQLDSKLSQVCVYLLEQPDLKLNTIADELGFCDEFHLSKVFKRKYGISPLSFKKKMHSGGADDPGTANEM